MMVLKINCAQCKNFTSVYQKFSSIYDKAFNFRLIRKFRDDSSSSSQTSSSFKNYKVVFIGSDSFSLPSLIELTKLLTPENVSVVVSNENNLVGKYAKHQNNRIYLWKDFKTADFKASPGAEYDFGVVASFGFLIPARVINRFPLGILNVHASLLPRWRGASPINHSIIYGDTETGVSIMKIAPHKFDVGPVYHRKAIPLDPHIRAPDLLKLLADLGAKALIEVIRDLPNFMRNPIYQDDSLASYAPKLSPEVSEVDWESKTAIEIYRLFRGLYGALKLRTSFNERRVDLDEIELPQIVNDSQSEISCKKDGVAGSETLVVNSKNLPSEGVPGQIVFVKDNLLVRCANSSGISTWICVGKLKIGLKWMSPKDFRNGFLSKGKLTSNTIPRFYLSKSVIEDKLSQRNL